MKHLVQRTAGRPVGPRKEVLTTGNSTSSEDVLTHLSSSLPGNDELAGLAWDGFHSYERYVGRLTAKGSRLTEPGKARLASTMVRQNWSCFWRAMLCAISVEQLPAFTRLMESCRAKGCKPSAPVDMMMACGLKDDFDVTMAWFDADWDEVHVLKHGREPVKGFTPGILLVFHDDAGDEPAHWLPIREVRPASKVGSSLASVPAVESDVAVSSNPFSVLRDECGVGEGGDTWLEVSEVLPEAAGGQPASTGKYRTPQEHFAWCRALENEARLFEEERGLREHLVEHERVARKQLGGRQVAETPHVPEDWSCWDAFSSIGKRVKEEHPPFCEMQFTEAYGHEAPPVSEPWKDGGFMRNHKVRWYGQKTDEVCIGAIIGQRSKLTGEWMKLYTPSYDRRLVEARKEVLLSTPVRAGDVLYARVRPDNVKNPNLMAGGCLKLHIIGTIECPGVMYKLGPVTETRQGKRVYNVATLEMVEDARGVMTRLIGKCLGKRTTPCRIAVDKVEDLDLQDPAHLKSAATKKSGMRTRYQLCAPLVRDTHPQLVGPLVDDRAERAGLEDPDLADVLRIHSEMIAYDRAVMAQLDHVPAFAFKKERRHKACVNCGVEPPEGKYRWKHRQCGKCKSMMDKLGYISWAGSQVQENLHVPDCYPGIVYRTGEMHPPPLKKWEAVDVYMRKKCLVKVNWHYSRVKTVQGERNDKWDAFEKKDLAKLKTPNPPKFTHALVGIACSGAAPMVSVQTPYTQGKALLARVFRKTPEHPWGPGPKPGRWAWARQFLKVLLPDFVARPMEFHDWLATMPKRRQAALLKGKERLDRLGWNKSCEKFKAFVKTEFLPGFSQCPEGFEDIGRLREMVDRIIQGPDEQSHCIAGPILKPFLTRLKELWTYDSEIFYASTTPDKLQKFLDIISEAEQCYFWCDFTQFENSHSKDTWEFMEALYGNSDPMFTKVMKAWRAPRGTIGPFKYEARVMNASGRDDTSLANNVLNGMASHLSAVAAYNEVPLDQVTIEMVAGARGKVRLAVCGDDSLGMLPRWGKDRLAKFKADMAYNISEFGFHAKLETSDTLTDAVFLGMRPYPTKAGWYWGKTIGRCTYKMAWSLKPQERDLMAQITGVADMHVRCSSHVPVVYDIAKRITQLREGAKRTPVLVDDARPWEWTQESGCLYDDLTLEAVARVYGTDVQEVKALICAINRVVRLPAVIDNDLWKRMIARDEL